MIGNAGDDYSALQENSLCGEPCWLMNSPGCPDHATCAWVAVPQTIHAKCAWTRMQLQSFKTGGLIERSCRISKRGSNYHSMKSTHWSCYLRLGGRPANYSFEMVLYGCKFWSDAEFQNFGVLIECSCLILKLRGSNNSLIDHVTCAWVAVVNYLCEMHLVWNAVK